MPRIPGPGSLNLREGTYICSHSFTSWLFCDLQLLISHIQVSANAWVLKIYEKGSILYNKVVFGIFSLKKDSTGSMLLRTLWESTRGLFRWPGQGTEPVLHLNWTITALFFYWCQRFRGPNKPGPWVKCPQKIVRPGAQWPLQMLADFNTCCMKYIRKANLGPDKYWGPSNLLCLGSTWPLNFLAYIDP